MRECPVCQYCFSDQIERCPTHDQATKPTLAVETVIRAKYQLEKRIGQGSVGIVYSAHDLIARTTHAVKIILPELVGKDRALSERFLREATAAADVRHPNIVMVTDSGLLKELIPFIVMEFVSGPSLQETLSARGALAPDEAFAYVSAIGAGLAAAHRHGIVHGDLKPRNILIEKDRPLAEAVKILDFGLSRIKSGKLHGPLATDKASSMLRSALYLAPEEWSDDEEPDHRSDIYSLGIILYQMLVGDLPFKGKSNPAIMRQHLLDSPPPMVGSHGPIARELEAVVQHALEKEPADRPATVEDLLEELRPAIDIAMRSSGKKKKRVPQKKTTGSRRRAPAPKSEQEVEEPSEPQFDGQATIVIRRPQVRQETPLDRAAEAPPVNLEQTIVLPRTRPAHYAPEPFTYRDEGNQPEPSVTSANEVAEPAEPQMDLGVQQTLESGVEPDIEEEMPGAVARLSAYGPADEAEQMPRSIPPVLLAVGVVLIVVLIGIGIYYSHITQ
jgi:serine/threonine protein kinase